MQFQNKAGRQEGRKEGREEGRKINLPAVLLCCLPAFLPPILIGCAHAQAKTTPDMPALEMPAPPPRDVEPNEVEPPPPVSLVAEPARNTPARLRPPPLPRPEPVKPEPPKPEPPPVEPPKPVVEEPAKPPTTLQTTPATAEGEVERSIRAALQRATTDLNRVDYRALNADARTQYDTVKSFLRQADDAMRKKNLVFARLLADKAAVLASQLAGR
jgi:outer membrane biosynthesis protein TonB